MGGNVWLNVLRADGKRILRDRFLLLIVTYLPFVAYFVFRWAIPRLTEYLGDKVDLVSYYPVISIILVMLTPYVFGCVLGLQMLTDKDEGSLNAIAVTPFSVHRYFFFRMMVYGSVAVVITIITHEIIGVIHIPLWQLILVCIAMLPNVGLSALVIASLAKNQVEGFAVMKGSGFLIMAPAMGFFVPQHWDLLLGIVPYFWPLKSYYLSIAKGPLWFFGLCIVLSFVTQIIALRFLYKFFARRVYGA